MSLRRSKRKKLDKEKDDLNEKIKYGNRKNG